jgi:hypothetical protein
MSTIKLGDRVKDSITGFKGIVTGRFEYLNGCVRLAVTPEELKDGKPVEDMVFDEGRLSGLTVEQQVDQGKRLGPGGPRDAPTRSDPVR